MARVLFTVMRMTTSDEALALAAAGGDGQAFSALITRHYDRVFRLAFRLTGLRAEVDQARQWLSATVIDR